MSFRPLAIKIAWRYLVAPKSHGAVSAISIISVVGVAVATAAIVIVLSVFNGFKFHLNARLDSLTPDVTIMPSYGKTIENGDSLAKALQDYPGVAVAMPEVTDNALIIAGSKEMPVRLKGVSPEIFSKITMIDSLLVDGSRFEINMPKQVSVAVGVAQRLGMYTAGDTLFLFAPKRHGRVNMANPLSSFLTDSIEVNSIFRSMQTEIDENTVICDIATARNLFQYDTEATSIQIKAQPGTDQTSLAKQLQESLGEDYIIKDRFQQQEVNFRMVAIEKWITFILLTFILVIASFNIISTLCMIILDKGGSLHTMSHLGMSARRIGTIFWWESVFVTLIGAGIGLILGVVLSLLQEKFALIKLAGDPESLVINAYPVRVEWLDLAITMIPIVAIGLVTAWISASFARSRVRQTY
ncbi:MAG: ABC transporter permease [Muribaculaceae bacterium]|nr:ABC transporter permease [Muribaculaceae bacterium]